MNNLKSLLKVSFINLTGINSLSTSVNDNKNKKKLLLTAFTIAFVAILIMFMSGLYSLGLVEALAPKASSISIEWKNLWIKRTLPISEKSIFISKIVTNLIVTVPISIIINIVFCIGLKYELIYLLLNILVSIAFAVANSIIGLSINLNFPKMEWTSATQVVKQSSAVLVSMLFSFLSIAIAVIIIIMQKITNFKLILLVALGVIIIVSLIAWRSLNTKGRELFKLL